jgi:hypothetical protein
MPDPEFLFGARNIAAALGKTPASVYHLIARNQLPGARRIGGQLALHLPTLRAGFAEAPAAPRRSLEVVA